MRHSHTTALVTAACLSLAALALTGTAAAAQTEAADCTTTSVRSGVSGSLKQCTWDDGRIRLVGTLRDTAMGDGATLLDVRVGTYARQWVICGDDTPVDTGYQPGGAVSFRWSSVSADRC
jgi:hypothetical protein